MTAPTKRGEQQNWQMKWAADVKAQAARCPFEGIPSPSSNLVESRRTVPHQKFHPPWKSLLGISNLCRSSSSDGMKSRWEMIALINS